LRILIAAVVVLLGVILFWPPVRLLFHFGQLHWDDLAACVAAGFLGLLLLERLKSSLFQAARTGGADGRQP
jgi:Ca2+-transporting ATPase